MHYHQSETMADMKLETLWCCYY